MTFKLLLTPNRGISTIASAHESASFETPVVSCPTIKATGNSNVKSVYGTLSLCCSTATRCNFRIFEFGVCDLFGTSNSKIRKLHLVAVEQHKESVPYTDFTFEFPVAFIVGHETTGVSKEALSLADAIVELPMYGVNISLNVMVSLAIVLYKV